MNIRVYWFFFFIFYWFGLNEFVSYYPRSWSISWSLVIAIAEPWWHGPTSRSQSTTKRDKEQDEFAHIVLVYVRGTKPRVGLDVVYEYICDSYPYVSSRTLRLVRGVRKCPAASAQDAWRRRGDMKMMFLGCVSPRRSWCQVEAVASPPFLFFLVLFLCLCVRLHAYVQSPRLSWSPAKPVKWCSPNRQPESPWQDLTSTTFLRNRGA